jgi:DNA ligase (NAD+)
MAGFELVREDVAGKVIFKPKGTLDGSAARLLEGLISDLDPNMPVEVDFSQVREFADVSVGNLLAAIDASRSRPLANLLFGLNIRHLGQAGAELVARARGSHEANVTIA